LQAKETIHLPTTVLLRKVKQNTCDEELQHMAKTRSTHGISLHTVAALSALFFTSQPGRADDLSARIVGGEKVTDLNDPVFKHSARLLIQAKILAAKGVPAEVVDRNVSWRCSAAIVAESALITAAHCLPDSIPLKDASTSFYRAPVEITRIEAFFGLSPRNDNFWGLPHSHYVRHPDYRDNWYEVVRDPWNPPNPVNDVGLIFLQRPVPAGKTPVALAVPAKVLQSNTLTMAGYGRSDPTNAVEIPELRKVAVPFIKSLINRADFFAGFGDAVKPRRIDNPKGACGGDSGGPAFAAESPSSDSLVLAGIVVRGPGDDSGGCESSITILTDVRQYNSWITEQLSP
jgi:hypothetical protein